jgi:hypothetical protein
MSHVFEPERAPAETYRLLRPGGWLAAFDGDYATTMVATGDHDPLQACVDAMMASSVDDRRVMRHLPTLLRVSARTNSKPRLRRDGRRRLQTACRRPVSAP